MRRKQLILLKLLIITKYYNLLIKDEMFDYYKNRSLNNTNPNCVHFLKIYPRRVKVK